MNKGILCTATGSTALAVLESLGYARVTWVYRSTKQSLFREAIISHTHSRKLQMCYFREIGENPEHLLHK